MGLILDFAEETNLPEFNECWQTFREMTRDGFSTFTIDEIGNLHAQMSMMLAHKQMQLANIETKMDSAKVAKELKYASVFYHLSKEEGKRTDKQKETTALVDEEYNKTVSKWLEIKTQYTIIKGETTALETAVNALSRELSRRFGK